MDPPAGRRAALTQTPTKHDLATSAGRRVWEACLAVARQLAAPTSPGGVAERLRADGHEVTYIAELEPGISDEAVLERASRSAAPLLTNDKEFGEPVFRQGKARAGVTWRKTGFGNKSGRRLRMVERLLTVAETAEKQDRDLLNDLTAVPTAYRLGQAPPALLTTP